MALEPPTGLRGNLPVELNLFFYSFRGREGTLKVRGKYGDWEQIRPANPPGDQNLQAITPEQGRLNLIHYHNRAQQNFTCFSLSLHHFTSVNIRAFPEKDHPPLAWYFHSPETGYNLGG